MASKFQRLWEDAEKKVRAFERVRDFASHDAMMHAALVVINRHNLSQEFVNEMCKPKSALECQE